MNTHKPNPVLMIALCLLVVGIGTVGFNRLRLNRTIALPPAQDKAALKLLKERGEYASLQQAMQTARYRAQASAERPGEFAALNPAQGLHARFTPQGLELRRRSDETAPQLAITLRGAGYGTRMIPVSPGTVSAEQQRVEIHRTIQAQHSALTEWYVNRPDGLEQGFTLSAPPGNRAGDERLQLALELSGQWQARASSNGQAIDFMDPKGRGALRYDHLVVRDARGQVLPARMSVHKQELRLEVDDADAVWPVTIDPAITQQAYLKASNTDADDFFGYSVAISGDTVVVGAELEDSNATGVNGNHANNGSSDSGAAYVFVRSGTTWSQQAYLKASNTSVENHFGASVAISGDTVVVGAPLEDSNATGVNGDQTSNIATWAGAAYVFVRSGTTWSQQAYLKASNTGTIDLFGYSVAISGEMVVVGAVGESSNATGVNADQTNNSAPFAGAAYVFLRSGTTWSQQAYLKTSNTEADDQFGISIAISGDTVAIGAYKEDSNATGVNNIQTNNSATDSGAAYVFIRNGTMWSQQAYLKASNTETNDFFGTSVAISGDTVVVGATQILNAAGSGAAYVFVRSGTTWSQQAYLKASNAELFELFGISVAISGDTVVVGAVGESSNATGVNGDQTNNDAVSSGAAYLFVRNSGTWGQQAYLKASNTNGGDNFGYSVAISGDTVAVGALSEDSNATGVNGDQNDNSAANSGAVYLFTITRPTITPGTTTLAQGSTANNSGVATISDISAGTLTVQATTVPSGISVTNIVDTGGTVTADVAATCAASVGANTVTLTVTNATTGLSNTADLIVNVTANTPPVLAYGAASVTDGSAALLNATTVTDNGFIAGYSIVSVVPPLSVAPTVNHNGVVSITNAGPSGGHTITVRATDNCGASTDASFILSVGCPAITVNPANSALPDGTTGKFYSQDFTAAGGASPYSFTVSTGALPGGVNLHVSGVLSGTATTQGAFNFTIRATAANGCLGERSYTIVIIKPGLMFYPLPAPVRLLDTRMGTSPNACSQPNVPIVGRSKRLQPARGFCGLPASAQAITGNVTTVQSAASSLMLYPSDIENPDGITSDYNPGGILNDAFTVRLDANDGAFRIFFLGPVNQVTDVIIDVTGYYAPPGPGGLYFHPLPKPIRLLETRAGLTGCNTPGVPLAGGADRAQGARLTCDGVTIPNEALAITGNATTVNPGGGYFTLYPANAARPLVASSNYLPGQVMNAPFTVGLSQSGEFKIHPTSQTDLVVDVVGYYSPEVSDVNGIGLLFTPLSYPVRLTGTPFGGFIPVCDNRSGQLLAGNTYGQRGRGACGGVIANNAQGLVGSIVVYSATDGYVTLWPSSAVRPTVAASNFRISPFFHAGTPFSRHFTVGLDVTDGYFNIFTSATINIFIDVSGFFAP